MSKDISKIFSMISCVETETLVLTRQEHLMDSVKLTLPRQLPLGPAARS